METKRPRRPRPIPDYATWRSIVLAERFLSEMEEWEILKEPFDREFDFAVLLKDGFTFFIEVKAVSSMHGGLKSLASNRPLTYPVSKELLSKAKTIKKPVVLFVFDADTEAGRYVRIDKLKPAAGTQGLHRPGLLPSHRINKESLNRLVSELRK